MGIKRLELVKTPLEEGFLCAEVVNYVSKILGIGFDLLYIKKIEEHLVKFERLHRHSKLTTSRELIGSEKFFRNTKTLKLVVFGCKIKNIYGLR